MTGTLSIRLAGADDIGIIEQLAHAIWPVTYGEILSPQQMHYMLNQMYSPTSLLQQLNQHHTFLIAELNDTPVGFAAYSMAGTGICKLHKLYVLPGIQGKGIGKALIDFIVTRLRRQPVTAIRLNVNRYNKARFFYEKIGFAVIAEEDIDIGNGYYMNDYVMEKPI